MSRHEETCPHCRAKTGLDGTPAAEAGPIAVPDLPDVPRVFRIHFADGHTRDYTLHPDGRLTLTVGGQVLATSLDFAFMADTSWVGGHIEWDPEPMTVVTAAEPKPAVVQVAFPLAA